MYIYSLESGARSKHDLQYCPRSCQIGVRLVTDFQDLWIVLLNNHLDKSQRQFSKMFLPGLEKVLSIWYKRLMMLEYIFFQSKILLQFRMISSNNICQLMMWSFDFFSCIWTCTSAMENNIFMKIHCLL